MIATLEEVSLNAFPALQTLHYDGWIVRLSKGYSRRGNSVQTYQLPTQPLAGKIAYCEKLYRDNGLLVIFKMTSASQPANLDDELAARGYQLEGDTSVHSVTLDNLAVARDETVPIAEQWSDEWYNEYCRMNPIQSPQRETLKTMLQLILPQAGYATVVHENRIRACGLGVVQDGYVGLFDIVVDRDARRRGFGRRLVSQLMTWGKQHGAHTAYLQVVRNNDPALKLYAQLGFAERYQYWYRIHR